MWLWVNFCKNLMSCPPDSGLFQTFKIWSEITGKGPVEMIKLVLIKQPCRSPLIQKMSLNIIVFLKLPSNCHRALILCAGVISGMVSVNPEASKG